MVVLCSSAFQKAASMDFILAKMYVLNFLCQKKNNHQKKRVNASHEHSKDVTQTQQRCHMNESVKSTSLVFVGFWVSEEECSV